ncbi:MAG: polysaccharide deacetylase [Actinobacteria bacterium]|nr:polysaccharide deacetylase [Actinomycetota bacterium]
MSPVTTAPTTIPPSSTVPSSSASASTHPTAPASNLAAGYVEPDGFVLTKLQPGEKAPQFVAVSFDGAGWHEKWDYFRGIAATVPFHFTANLTGLYLMDGQHRTYYHGPHHKPGATSLGSWNTPAEVSQQISDLNRAYADGNEIATHFMGHFCDDNPPGAGTWTTADWNSDLDQFFDVWKNYRTIDQNAGLPTLAVPASSVKGARTPCLQGSKEQLFPALAAHGFTYDQSFTRRGISWPTKSPQYGIWNMGMAEFPMHGTVPGFGAGHVVITMDYNFWYTQEADPRTGQMRTVSPEKSAADSRQVQATYQDMLDGALAGSHAPLLLGNHFEEWNNNAYTDALGNFLIANCGRPEVHCVPFRDIVDWMSIQDPATLARLQAAPPVLGPPNSGFTQP